MIERYYSRNMDPEKTKKPKAMKQPNVGKILTVQVSS